MFQQAVQCHSIYYHSCV